MTDLHPNFFRREPDGSVRLRLRFDAEEASMIEEGAGATRLIDYIKESVLEAAKHDAQDQQERLHASAG